MTRRRSISFFITTVGLLVSVAHGQTSYLGFDRNDYPGDASLKSLRQTFSYSGYWLNNPPGAKVNSWTGHRAAVESAGFGFLVLFNGRLYAELKSVANATHLGQADAQAAVSAARREGFPRTAVIFLDQEEGGRMLPEQKAYIYAWVDGVSASGFRPGLYCSGIVAKESGGASIITADDVRQSAAGRKIVYFVANDACPPSPGCAFPARPPNPTQSGVNDAKIWQFAQSPRRKDVAASCKGYDSDGDCNAPGLASAPKTHLDLNTATTSDPSNGRTH